MGLATDHEVIVLRANGDHAVHDFPDDFLNFCYREIECDLVDRIAFQNDIDMWVDDEGMFTKTINYPATFLCRRLGYPADGIFGTAVICGLRYTDDGPEAGPLDFKRYKVVRDAILASR